MTNKNIDSNRESSKEHAQERVSNNDNREIRPTNRDIDIILNIVITGLCDFYVFVNVVKVHRKIVI